MIVTDLVRGVSLDKAWHSMTREQRYSMKTQLRVQVQLFRRTQSFIGRIAITRHQTFMKDLVPDMNSWVHSSQRKSLIIGVLNASGHRSLERCGNDFFPECVSHLIRIFVLTHCDLSARNIMVEDGKITGILDWEHSGFFPKYMEYVTAIEICDGYEDWWRPV